MLAVEASGLFHCWISEWTTSPRNTTAKSSRSWEHVNFHPTTHENPPGLLSRNDNSAAESKFEIHINQ